MQGADRVFSLANEEERIDEVGGKEKDWTAVGQEWRSGYEECYNACTVAACMLLYTSITSRNHTHQVGDVWVF